MSELEQLQEENKILKQALKDQIDYHIHINNNTSPILVDESFVYLYDIAKTALKTTKSWEYGY